MSDMNKSNNIMILGSIALDSIQTKYGKEKDLLGGSATYATIAAGIFSSIIPVGIVGNDFPQSGHDIFSKYSYNLNNLITKSGSTFRWGGKYHDNGDDRDTIFTDLGVFETFDPVIHNDDKNVSWIFLANIHPSLQLKVLNQCIGKPKVVLDTMNLWIQTSKDELIEVIKCSDILLINESELIELCESENIKNSAHEILELGCEKIIVKKGSKGASCYTKNNEINIGVYPIKKVVDPTGAGDVFGGGFISGLVEGLSTYESMKRGTALASFCIEDFGVNRLINIELEELNYRINLIE